MVIVAIAGFSSRGRLFDGVLWIIYLPIIYCGRISDLNLQETKIKLTQIGIVILLKRNLINLYWLIVI